MRFSFHCQVSVYECAALNKYVDNCNLLKTHKNLQFGQTLQDISQ